MRSKCYMQGPREHISCVRDSTLSGFPGVKRVSPLINGDLIESSKTIPARSSSSLGSPENRAKIRGILRSFPRKNIRRSVTFVTGTGVPVGVYLLPEIPSLGTQLANYR